MLSWDVPSRPRAIRFSLIWGALAAALFIIAAILTAIILQYNPRESPTSLRVAITVRPPVQPPRMPLVDYTQPDGRAQLVFLFVPSAATIYISPPVERCEDVEGNPYPKADFAPILGDRFSRVTFHVRLRGPGSDFMRCFSQPLIAHESFIDRRLDAEYFHPDTDEKRLIWVLALANIPDADRVRFTGGLPGQQPESERIINENYRTTSRWQSLSAESTRDILLVVIGSLIALGAATLLEALRPVVDVLSAKSDKTGG